MKQLLQRAVHSPMLAPVRAFMLGTLDGGVSPSVGAVQFGDLRRLRPISQVWGLDRGLPIDRYYIELFLARESPHIQRCVLEVGDNQYTSRFGGARVTASDVLHATPSDPLATIIGDLTDADHIPSDRFDCIILTQTLPLIYDVPAAIRTVFRILKPGGVVLATMPGITPLSDAEGAGEWYWNFTRLSAGRLFRDRFPESSVTVATHGNVLSAQAFLQGLAAEELSQDELAYADGRYEVTITVKATKPLQANGGSNGGASH